MTDIVFDFTDIASRVNRAKKPEPVAVKPAPSPNASNAFHAAYQAACQAHGQQGLGQQNAGNPYQGYAGLDALCRSKACR